MIVTAAVASVVGTPTILPIPPIKNPPSAVKEIARLWILIARPRISAEAVSWSNAPSVKSYAFRKPIVNVAKKIEINNESETANPNKAIPANKAFTRIILDLLNRSPIMDIERLAKTIPVPTPACNNPIPIAPTINMFLAITGIMIKNANPHPSITRLNPNKVSNDLFCMAYRIPSSVSFNRLLLVWTTGSSTLMKKRKGSERRMLIAKKAYALQIPPHCIKAPAVIDPNITIGVIDSRHSEIPFMRLSGPTKS